MQTPDDNDGKQQRQQHSGSDADISSSGSVPDLIRGPAPNMSPMDMVNRAIRGFCTPHQRPSGSERSGGSMHDESNIDRYNCLPPANNLFFDAVEVGSSVSGDEHPSKAHHSQEQDRAEDVEDEDDDDDGDVLVVETVPGTGRIVRVVRALEIFLCTVALLLLTFKSLQRLGVQLELHPKDAADAASFAWVGGLARGKQQEPEVGQENGDDKLLICPELVSSLPSEERKDDELNVECILR